MLNVRSLRLALLALAPLAPSLHAQAPAQQPLINFSLATKVAPGITVIPDGLVGGVPDIGIVEGKDSVLVIDAGLGIANGEALLKYVQEIAGKRKIFLTTTHWHVEHTGGAPAFAGHARYIVDKTQADEISSRFQDMALQWRARPNMTALLQTSPQPMPDETFATTKLLNLGGRRVVLTSYNTHTKGDETVWIPDAHLLFAGSIADSGKAPNNFDHIAPAQWISVLKTLEALKPRIVVGGHGPVGGIEILQTAESALRAMPPTP